MEIAQVADSINARIQAIEKLCKQLDEAGDKKADAIASYDKELAKATIRLLMGKITSIDDEPLTDKPPTTLIPTLAKGLVYNERLALELTTNKYKSLTSKIDSLSATLNAKQSIFRHLETEARYGKEQAG